jgi:RimJ/RimL family protein N-acetyltransferase
MQGLEGVIKITGGFHMVSIRLLEDRDAKVIAMVYLKNRENMKAYEPVRTEEFYTEEYQRKLIEESRKSDTAYSFGIFINQKLIGKINIGNIAKGAFRSAYMGYWIDEDYRNKGYMSQEFDPGSGRTLAACLTHASRTGHFSFAKISVANG